MVEGAGWFPTGAFFDDLLPNRTRPSSEAPSASSLEHRPLLLVPPFDHDYMWTPSDGCGTFVRAVLDRLRMVHVDSDSINNGNQHGAERFLRWPPPPLPRNDALQEMLLINADTSSSGSDAAAEVGSLSHSPQMASPSAATAAISANATAAAVAGGGGDAHSSKTNHTNTSRVNVWKQIEQSWLQAPSAVEGLLFGRDTNNNNSNRGSSSSNSDVSSSGSSYSGGGRSRSSSHPSLPTQPPPPPYSSPPVGTDTLWRAWRDIGGALTSTSSNGPFG